MEDPADEDKEDDDDDGSISSGTSYSNGMHMSGDDTDDSKIEDKESGWHTMHETEPNMAMRLPDDWGSGDKFNTADTGDEQYINKIHTSDENTDESDTDDGQCR